MRQLRDSCGIASDTLFLHDSRVSGSSGETEVESMARSQEPERPRRRRRRLRRSEHGLTVDEEIRRDEAILDEIDRPVHAASAAAPAPPAAPVPVDPRAGYDHDIDPDLDSDYERARMRAERKAELYIDGAKKGGIVLILLIIPPLTWLGFILGIVWGIRFARRYFSLMIEPGLRERIVEDEVEKEVHVNVSRERRSLEGEHSRSLEQLSASIAHEIRNPITAAKSLVQQMGEDPTAADNPEYAKVAVEELQRVERSITHLLRFARDEEMRLAPVLMVDVLESALETFRDRAARAEIEIVRRFDCDGALEGDADKLRRVVINLVGNAIDALVDANVEHPRVDVSMGENLAGTEVWVRITDNGLGIDDEVRQKIFSPFVTSKSGGTGLGLPITKKLVEAHGGSIEVHSEPGAGAEFVLTFPKRVARPKEPSARPKEPSARPKEPSARPKEPGARPEERGDQ